MALTGTILSSIRTQYPSDLDKYENRIQQTGLLTSVLEMQSSPNSILTSEVRDRATNAAQGLLTQIPVINDGDFTLTTARTCSVAGGENTSALVNVSWNTLVGSIAMTPGQYENNSVKYMADLSMKIQRMVEKMNKAVETTLATNIDNGKSQVYGATSLVAASGAKYALTGSAIRVTNAQQNLFFNDVDPINLTDDFNGPYKVVCNHTVMPTVRNWINQGEANSSNTRYQFEGNRIFGSGSYDFSFSNGFSNGSGVKGTGYIMPDGAIGFMTRLDVDARAGHSSTQGDQWSIETLPGLPWQVGLKYNSGCADKNTISGGTSAHLTATLEETWQFSFDYAVLTPYNSDIATRSNPIRKFEFL